MRLTISQSSSCYCYAGEKTLVTGATGFLGRHLIKGLIAQNAQVRAMTRSDPQAAQFPDNVEYCRGALEDVASLERACQDVVMIFHAAGHAHAWSDASPTARQLHRRINAEGTCRLLQTAAKAGVQRFVFLSSVKAMGAGGKNCLDETWPLPPETPYGLAKREAEQQVIACGHQYNMHTVNLRLALVYGPDGRGNLDRMIKAIRRGFFPPLPNIDNKRSMVHVDDVVQAALRAGSCCEADRKTYIVTDGHAYSSREIYEMICRALGKPIPNWYVPYGVLRSLAKIGDGLGWMRGKRMIFDSEALDKMLGWAWYRCDKIQAELDYRPSFILADALPAMVRT